MDSLSFSPAACATDILLRAMGGRSVFLRLPAPAVPADATEQLGLATPLFQDIPLAPAVYRKARATLAAGKPPMAELLISASAIQRIVGSLAFASANILFASAVGILSGPDESELFEIVSTSSEEANGQPYVYRLLLRAPQAQIV